MGLKYALTCSDFISIVGCISNLLVKMLQSSDKVMIPIEQLGVVSVLLHFSNILSGLVEKNRILFGFVSCINSVTSGPISFELHLVPLSVCSNADAMQSGSRCIIFSEDM